MYNIVNLFIFISIITAEIVESGECKGYISISRVNLPPSPPHPPKFRRRKIHNPDLK